MEHEPRQGGGHSLTKVGGKEGYNVDNLDCGGKRMSCQEIKSRNYSHSTK